MSNWWGICYQSFCIIFSFSFWSFRVSDSELPPSTGPVFPLGNETSASVPNLMGPSWQEQDVTLRDLWLQNKTPQEISAVLNRSIAAIMTRAARLGLPRRSAPGRKPGSRRVLDPNQSQDMRTSSPRPASRGARDSEVSPQASARICLMCLRSFQSQGRHNRICSSCKGSSEYESAVALADIHFPV